ncbi:MAG: ATP synthase subunit I [bacterium]|nr:ATP synthase subunit I [bacterium]
MKEITLSQITKTAWILIAMVFLISLLTRNLSIISGIGVGSLLGWLNFKGLIITTQRGFRSSRPKLYIQFSYLVRLTILGLILIIILQIKAINFIAVIMGLSIIMLAILVEGIRGRY